MEAAKNGTANRKSIANGRQTQELEERCNHFKKKQKLKIKIRKNGNKNKNENSY